MLRGPVGLILNFSNCHSDVTLWHVMFVEFASPLPYEISDDPEKGRLVWLQGMAGVGKSAVAFTIAERNQRVSE